MHCLEVCGHVPAYKRFRASATSVTRERFKEVATQLPVSLAVVVVPASAVAVVVAVVG